MKYAERKPIRPPVPAEHRGYICPTCDLLLADSVAYEHCPSCGLRVDWIDLRTPLWACADCDRTCTTNAHCAACQRAMTPIHDPADRRPATERRRRSSFFYRPEVLGGLWVLLLAPVLSMAMHPEFRAMVLATTGPLLLVPVVAGGVFLYLLARDADELYALLRRREVRIAHGLEHATLRVLEERGFEIVCGHTADSSFVIVVGRDVRPRDVRSAFREAVRRVRSGDRTLAYDRRCGTSMIVGALLASIAAVLAGVIGLFTTLPPAAVAAVLVVFAFLLTVAITPLGLLAQRTMTVSTVFRKAGLARVARRGDDDDYRCYEVFADIHMAA